jgi:hypothetical protein
MIALGRERLNGHVAPRERGVPENPCRKNKLSWLCFEILKYATAPMHYKSVYDEVAKMRECTKSGVYNAMYEDETHFKRGEPGFFTVAGS